MATATLTQTETKAPKSLKTFKLTCPQCGATDAIHIDLNDLTTCVCSACSDEFTPQTAVKKMTDQLRRWQAVATWVGLAGAVLANTEAGIEIDPTDETETETE